MLVFLSALLIPTYSSAEQDVLAMVPNMCPEEAYPEAMQAVEESLRLKFQRGTIMSCRSSGGASIGLKRQRNLCLDTDRELSKANRSHDTFLEQFLVQQQQVMAAQHLISQPGTQPDVLRHQYQLPQSQFVQASHQHFAENPQQHLLTQDHLLRAIASPGSSADPTPGREEPEQPQQQQIVMAIQGLRTRGQNQQPLLSHQLPSVGPTVHGMSLQQQIMGANSQQARTTPE
ncbi:uncharacterized protein EMH_0017240 [Eimeria mitis]|uniref:Uncharacterized protein n=1 Tax=Eimeria mitis TaxID=44415 RepID=U6JVG1_9EIME|nr:uncharacterized protein EMH_0017240 [Eimeria mitis]CDJ28766.1 hypothetical protein EMH_0017240 [Eimeria mitis]